MKSYKVYDNFLKRSEFLKIKTVLESWNFPWYFQPTINLNHSYDDLDCYFTHNIFNQELGRSSSFDLVAPILNKLNIKSLIRVKCNLYPRTDNVNINKPHTDFNFKHKGAIFYINTNDGGTIMKDKSKVDSVENRLLIFEPHHEHSSTTTSNKKCRININFNYF